MKKFWKITKYVILALLIVGTFAYVTWDFYTEGYSWYTRDYKRVCYGIWCVVFTMFFCKMIDKFKRLWTKITAGIVTSWLYTSIVFLANNFWQYICINHNFNWENPIPLGVIMERDITYTYGYGEYRYPAVFAIMFVLCGLKILFSYPHIKSIYHDWIDKLEKWLYIKNLLKEDIEELYCKTLEAPETQRFIEYVKNMPLDEENKQKMIMCVDRFCNRDHFLIYLLLRRFGKILDREEYIKYRALYVEIGQAYIKEKVDYYSSLETSLPEFCNELDKKFNITDKE